MPTPWHGDSIGEVMWVEVEAGTARAGRNEPVEIPVYEACFLCFS